MIPTNNTNKNIKKNITQITTSDTLTTSNRDSTLKSNIKTPTVIKSAQSPKRNSIAVPSQNQFQNKLGSKPGLVKQQTLNNKLTNNYGTNVTSTRETTKLSSKNLPRETIKEAVKEVKETIKEVKENKEIVKSVKPSNNLLNDNNNRKSKLIPNSTAIDRPTEKVTLDQAQIISIVEELKKKTAIVEANYLESNNNLKAKLLDIETKNKDYVINETKLVEENNKLKSIIKKIYEQYNVEGNLLLYNYRRENIKCSL